MKLSVRFIFLLLLLHFLFSRITTIGVVQQYYQLTRPMRTASTVVSC